MLCLHIHEHKFLGIKHRTSNELVVYGMFNVAPENENLWLFHMIFSTGMHRSLKTPVAYPGV